MAINRRTLRLLRELRIAVGSEADGSTRALATAWARAWDELSTLYLVALEDLLLLVVRLERWPHPYELRQLHRLVQAQAAADEALRTLAARTEVVVTDSAGRVIEATGQAEPRLIASQLPAAMQVEAAAVYAARVLPRALDVIVARTTAQIVSSTRPLSSAASEAMRRALIQGIALGENPRETGRLMLRRVEGEFNGGLARATTIARTEILDAYRVTSQYAHAQNADVLSGWIWACAFGRRTCPACWGMHGTFHELSEPGPWDHQNGRCARVPALRPWSELGIKLKEPPSVMPDARERFDALSAADQLHIMGPGRLELLKSGRITFADLPVERPSVEWRTSYGPRPVTDLQSLAAQRGS